MQITKTVATSPESTTLTDPAIAEKSTKGQKMNSRPANLRFPTQEHHYPQVWLLVTTLAAFALYIAWDLGLIRTIVALDRSYIATIIAALALLATCHAAWHIFLFSQRIEASQIALEEAESLADTTFEDRFLAVYLNDLEDAKSGIRQTDTNETAESDSVIEIYADKLRSPVDLGWFLVDLAVRLGLVGTIIGFILIFTSLSGSSIEGADGLKELLVTMSGGMGTALFTTLSGLVGATFLSLQYLILGREAETLIGLLVRLRNRHNAVQAK